MNKYSLSEVKRHNTAEDCWVVIEDQVFNLTSFLADHPGGKQVIARVAGTDATDQFLAIHDKLVLLTDGAPFKIGILDVAPKIERKRQYPRYGSLTPFAEPYWYNSKFKSPYYNESHKLFRDKVRKFVDVHMRPFAGEWDEQGTYPVELPSKLYKAGLLAAMWPVEYGGTPPEGCNGQPDAFHDLIFWDEIARCGSGGVMAAVFISMAIGLPPLLGVASDAIKQKVVPGVLRGEKILCLAITEPYAGSDVAQIQTTAERVGDHYIVNGEKKFITSGCKADFFVVVVRTGAKDSGMAGISLLLLEKGMPGLKARRMKTQGWWSSNTAYLTFEDVKVPASNLVGVEGMGFLPIMHQFNHERFVAFVAATRACRSVIQTAVEYARSRKTFGKRLIDHQVIRHKIGEMSRRTEALQASMELYAYQVDQGLNQKDLGIWSALFKVNATRALEFCCREASQIMGGASYIRGGPGQAVERAYREVRVSAIGGGSEEIMIDLAMRQSKL